MSNTITSPNMNLPVPVVSQDPGPDFATNINSCLGAIDSHNHTSGNGVAIPPSGLNINSDLSMGDNSLAATKSVIFQAQSSFATNLSIYTILNDLYYNDGAGNIVRITQSGSVSGSAGTITGLPSGTASAAYSSGSGTFIFQSSTNTPANIDGRSFILRNNASSSKGLTLNPPSAMGSDITETFPSPPAATSLMTMSSAGAMGVPFNVTALPPASTQPLVMTSAGVIQSPGAGVVNAQESGSCGSYTVSTGSFVQITNFSVAITTRGGVVQILIKSDGSGSDGFYGLQTAGAGASLSIHILRNGTIISRNALGVFANTLMEWPGLMFQDNNVGAGAQTYTIEASVTTGVAASASFNNLKMCCTELIV